MKKDEKIIFDTGSYNIIFIVVDSCRFDTAEKAHTPFLDSVSILRRAEAPGTYTLPSHMSFFIGILPVLIDGNPEYLPGISQIWRSVQAKNIDKSVAVVFQEKNIINYYEKRDYDVLGAGGVSFFSSVEENILPNLFSRFIYFEKPVGVPKVGNVPRLVSQFPLANIDKIVSNMDTQKPFFLFINCPETHMPFDCPGMCINQEYKTAIEKLYSIDSVKHSPVPKNLQLSNRERLILLDAQQRSLEWINDRLSSLYEKIRNDLPTLFVVMGDHGDELGEGGRYGHAHYHPLVMLVPLWCGIVR